jgi:predicted RNA polymerase sigma factor
MEGANCLCHPSAASRKPLIQLHRACAEANMDGIRQSDAAVDRYDTTKRRTNDFFLVCRVDIAILAKTAENAKLDCHCPCLCYTTWTLHI